MTQTTATTWFGPLADAQGVTFRLWAPSATSVAVVLGDESRHLMAGRDDGFFEVFISGVGVGQHYLFEADGRRVPDPASRLQSDDVFDWSMVCGRTPAPGFAGRRPWHEAIICEIHVGTATPEGSFAGLASRLPALAAAGYTVIELMPIGDFPGRRSWGYDGVLLFAPDRGYGTPEDLRALIAKAHELSLSVMLDVVYNHFGPSGNFLAHYAQDFFAKEHQTPWGAAINFADSRVRRFFVENACMWIGEYGFDGLRFDAVHAFVGEGGDLLLAEIADAVREIDPQAYLVLENDHNAARWLERTSSGPISFDAQWNDDYHHVFHVLATEERSGYYVDYQDDPVAAARRVLAEGFLYQGQPSAHRNGASRGEPSAHLHPTAFVGFLQNHDQIGNRAFGERLVTLSSPERLVALRFALLLSPQIPLLFMGEEFAAATPFQYFCDYDGELADAVREGRKLEFKSFEDLTHDRISVTPDPNDPETFAVSRLDWGQRDSLVGQRSLAEFQVLVALRRQTITPLLGGSYLGVEVFRNETAFVCHWRFAGGAFAIGLNLADSPASLPGYGGRASLATTGTVAEQDGAVRLGPWSGIFWGSS